MIRAMLPMLLVTATSTFAMTSKPRVEVPASVQDLYIPFGFDSNDNVEVTLNLQYHNTCYKQGDIFSSIDDENKIIHIKASSYYEEQPFCGLMLTFSTEVVSLGIIPAGDYTILVNGEALHDKPDSINIAEASNIGPDDFNYLPIGEISESGKIIKLEGYYQVPQGSDNCYELDRIDIDNQEKVLVILPKGKFVKCQGDDEIRRISLEIDASTYLDTSKLVHVRSANGKSLNKIIPFFIP